MASTPGKTPVEDNIVPPIADGREYPILLGETFRNGVDNSNQLFHSLQYSWKPTSINEEERGVLQYALDAEVVAEYKNKGSDDVWLLHGQYKRCKDTECVLIFDGTSFTLERLTGYGMVKPTKTKTSHIPATLDAQAQRKEKRSLSDSEVKTDKVVTKRRKVQASETNGQVVKAMKEEKPKPKPKPRAPRQPRKQKQPTKKEKAQKKAAAKEKGVSSDSDLDLVSQLEQGLDEAKEEVIEEIEEEVVDEEMETGGMMGGKSPASIYNNGVGGKEPATTTTTTTTTTTAPSTTGGKGLSFIGLPTLIENNVTRSPLSESSSENDSSSESDSDSDSDSESDDEMLSGSSSQSSSESESDSESD